MRCLALLFTAILLAFPSSSPQATIIHVPADSATVQGGINGAVNGDTVLVHPGTYVENIDFLGKAIVVRSESGPDSTIIDGNHGGSVVTFASGENTDSIIEGFTITNGSGTYVDGDWEYAGGGIYCDGSAPTIQYNEIAGNTANNGGGIVAGFTSPAVIIHNIIFANSAIPSPGHIGGGGGIAIAFDSDAVVSFNDIHNNLSGVAGGGIACGFGSAPEVTNNTIRDNVANVYGGGIQIYSFTAGTFYDNLIMGNASFGANGAGGISCRLGSSPVIANNLIIYNSAVTYGGGIRCFDSATPTVMNSVIFGNEADISGGGVECDDGASATVANTFLWDNQAPAGTEIWIGPRAGSPGALTISYSDVKDGMASVHVDPGATLNWGAGMIDDEPRFRRPGANDFHLMATSCGDSLDSPCIDAGDPAVTDSLLDCSHGLGAMRSDVGAYGGRGAGPTVTIEIEAGAEIVGLPKSLQLFQNYPNPFNPSTTIAFVLSPAGAAPQQVTLRIYDVSGRLVRTLIDTRLSPGRHTATWDGRSDQQSPLGSGVYAYRLEVEDQALSKTLVLAK